MNEQATVVATALLKLGVFGAGAYLSVLLMWTFLRDSTGHQIYLGESVGLIFGAVILVWHTTSVKELIGLRSLGFLTASTLIWILAVYPVSDMTLFLIPSTFRNVFLRDWYGPIILGTILLPIAHSWLLKKSWRRALMAIPLIIGIWILGDWYLFRDFVTTRNFTSELGLLRQEIAHVFSIPIWQGAYLLCMFGSIPQFLKARFLLFRKT